MEPGSPPDCPRQLSACQTKQNIGSDDDMPVKQVKVGDCLLGDGKIYIQSMLNVAQTILQGNVEQAVRLEQAGCEILRVAVPDRDAVRLIPAIKERIGIPLVADIHFDYRLALESAVAGLIKFASTPATLAATIMSRLW